MPNEEKTFTPSEAAVASGVSVKIVHREIDEGPLKARRKRPGDRRLLCEEDLFYLALAKGIDTELIQFTSEGKNKLYHTIATQVRQGISQKGKCALFGGGLAIDFKHVFEEVRSRLGRLDRARKMVVEDPEIRGGEPCIKGTRIGVYEIADMLDQGASEAEILEGYPSLKRYQLELAKTYAQAYPRRGRPPSHPWHQRPWREIARGALPH